MGCIEKDFIKNYDLINKVLKAYASDVLRGTFMSSIKDKNSNVPRGTKHLFDERFTVHMLRIKV